MVTGMHSNSRDCIPILMGIDSQGGYMTQIIQDMASDANVQHISVQQITDRTGLDRKTVSLILSGETESPKLQTLQDIASCLGGSIGYITNDSRNAVKTSDISYYRTMISDMKNQLMIKEKWLKWLFFTCIGLTAIDAITTIIAFLIAASL